MVAVSVAYAKNVLFPKNLAKLADAGAKNAIAHKKEQDKKHTVALGETWDKLMLYVTADEPLIIKRKVTPSGGLYEKVHETDVKQALTQWEMHLPAEFTLAKGVWDAVGSHQVAVTRGAKKTKITFIIKESHF
jgi:ribosomal protein L9